MKKAHLFASIIILILFANLSLAANLNVKKTDKGSVIVKQLNNPAIFDFDITNLGSDDLFEIYTLVSVTMLPKEKFELPKGESTIEISAVPNQDFREREPGLINFEYEIQGENSGIFKDKLLVKMIDLKDLFSFEIDPISTTSTQTKVRIKNTQKAHIPEVSIKFDSIFFNAQETLAFEPLEEKEITISLNNPPADNLKAGKYIVTITIPHTTEGETTYSEYISYLEKEAISTNQDSSGFIIRKTKSSKINTGNVDAPVEIEITKGIIGRFFTTNSPEPTKTERDGFSVTYTWEKDLAPTE
ncbi:MAG: hypothetical protein KC506_02510, partial [Nanoarchaeota archaeon]|nr:hypothetical protein [Nanoarchaeota archaeon]